MLVRITPPAPLVRHLRLSLSLSLLLLLLHVALAARLRYAFFRPLFYHADTPLADFSRRQARAKAYLSSPEFLQAPLVPHSPHLCVGVQQSPRSPPTIHRTLASLAGGGSHPFSLLILDSAVDAPSPELEILHQNPHAHLPIWSRVAAIALYENLTAQRFPWTHDWVSKQRADYALTLFLLACPLSAACPHVLVLENDAVLARNAVERLVYSLQLLAAKDADWGMVRLFRSDFWAGWERNEDRPIFVRLAAGGLVAGLVLTRSAPSRAVRLVWIVFCVAWAVLVPLLLGKQHTPWGQLVQPSGIIDATHLGSVSSIAHVYPRALGCELAKYLVSTCCVQRPQEVDLAIEHFLEPRRFYELVPNLADHVGFASTSAIKVKDFENEFAERGIPHHVASSSFDARGVQFR